MTLRHRLLLVYLIVVLLSGATVGVAVFELKHSHRIIQQLQVWNAVALEVEKVKSGWPPPLDMPLEDIQLKEKLLQQLLALSDAPEYLNADDVREAILQVHRNFDQWAETAGKERTQPPDPVENPTAQQDIVKGALNRLSIVIESELDTLNLKADLQTIRMRILLVTVAGLTLLHVLVVGSLLRRWLLRPMEQLNRQVAALGKDEPPPEPLVTAPVEMANLATALDQARQALGSLRQELIDGERLTTIGQFAAQLAHNLRNPLASIRAAAQLTSRAESASAEVRERMMDVIASVDRLNQWIMRLTDVVKAEPQQTGNLDVVPTLQRVRDALSAELSAKELSLTISVPSEGLACAHDPAILEHALIAMVVNAIEASPLGGPIEVKAEPVCGNGEPAMCRISVRDRGCGLPADAPERIFEFSYSTKQRGMGLGLALARQAVQRQGGVVHASNNPEGGATVAIELPIRQPPDVSNGVPNAQDSDR